MPLSRPGSDEGGATDSLVDDHLCTWDWILSMLAGSAPQTNTHWAELVFDVCEAKKKAVGAYSLGDEEIATLLLQRAVNAHAQYGQFVAAAKAAFPYARCFGASGALRDFDTTPFSTPPKKAAPKKAAPTKELEGSATDY